MTHVHTLQARREFENAKLHMQSTSQRNSGWSSAALFSN
jgi:hypothetical protein